jgi:glycosyltransferase involved in cell wall biosynthesis
MNRCLLSILIPTLEARRDRFASLHDGLKTQIAQAGLEAEVEILYAMDRGELPTGAKRNALLDRAQGEFVVFADDDDDVSPDYVSRICRAIESRPGVDCIGIKGIITFRGTHPRCFIHSLKYSDYSSKGGVYTRPPYHLNPIRRAIAASYRFREVYYSEDIEWALRVRNDRRLRSEVFIDSVLYYYHSRRRWGYQWLLDRTESLRHRLGLRLANRFLLYPAPRPPLSWNNPGPPHDVG